MKEENIDVRGSFSLIYNHNMNNPNYANLNRSHDHVQPNNSPGSMGSPYGAMDGDMMGDEQNDALQVRPVEHLESMSKLPAHKRRFSLHRFHMHTKNRKIYLTILKEQASEAKKVITTKWLMSMRTLNSQSC